MPLSSVLFLGLVVGALTWFASVLAYGEWMTRRAVIEEAQRILQAQKSANEAAAAEAAYKKAA